MDKDRKKISISVDSNLNEELEKSNYNKSKLINSLLDKWLKLEKKEQKNLNKKV